MEEMEDGFYIIDLILYWISALQTKIWHRPSCNFWNLSLFQHLCIQMHLVASLSEFEYMQPFNSFKKKMSSFPDNVCIHKTTFKNKIFSWFGSCKSLWASRKMLEYFLKLTWRETKWKSDLNTIKAMNTPMGLCENCINTRNLVKD